MPGVVCMQLYIANPATLAITSDQPKSSSGKLAIP